MTGFRGDLTNSKFQPRFQSPMSPWQRSKSQLLMPPCRSLSFNNTPMNGNDPTAIRLCSTTLTGVQAKPTKRKCHPMRVWTALPKLASFFRPFPPSFLPTTRLSVTVQLQKGSILGRRTGNDPFSRFAADGTSDRYTPSSSSLDRPELPCSQHPT